MPNDSHLPEQHDSSTLIYVSQFQTDPEYHRQINVAMRLFNTFIAGNEKQRQQMLKNNVLEKIAAAVTKATETVRTADRNMLKLDFALSAYCLAVICFEQNHKDTLDYIAEAKRLFIDLAFGPGAAETFVTALYIARKYEQQDLLITTLQEIYTHFLYLFQTDQNPRLLFYYYLYSGAYYIKLIQDHKKHGIKMIKHNLNIAASCLMKAIPFIDYDQEAHGLMNDWLADDIRFLYQQLIIIIKEYDLLISDGALSLKEKLEYCRAYDAINDILKNFLDYIKSQGPVFSDIAAATEIDVVKLKKSLEGCIIDLERQYTTAVKASSLILAENKSKKRRAKTPASDPNQSAVETPVNTDENENNKFDQDFVQSNDNKELEDVDAQYQRLAFSLLRKDFTAATPMLKQLESTVKISTSSWLRMKRAIAIADYYIADARRIIGTIDFYQYYKKAEPIDDNEFEKTKNCRRTLKKAKQSCVRALRHSQDCQFVRNDLWEQLNTNLQLTFDAIEANFQLLQAKYQRYLIAMQNLKQRLEKIGKYGKEDNHSEISQKIKLLKEEYQQDQVDYYDMMNLQLSQSSNPPSHFCFTRTGYLYPIKNEQGEWGYAYPVEGCYFKESANDLPIVKYFYSTEGKFYFFSKRTDRDAPYLGEGPIHPDEKMTPQFTTNPYLFLPNISHKRRHSVGSIEEFIGLSIADMHIR